MERMAMKRLWADFSFQDHLNPGPKLEVDNRRVIALAYQSLHLSFNVPTPGVGTPQVPQNTLDVEFFSRGWDGTFQSEEKPWL